MSEFIIYGRLNGLNEYTSANRSNRYKGSQMKLKNESIVIEAIKRYQLQKIKKYPIKLRHPGLLFSNKELANKFNTRCLCPKCNLEFKYNEVTGYYIDSTKKMEFGILSALWQVLY